MIEKTRRELASSVNTGQTLLYWQIGNRIQKNVLKGERTEYGKEILATLSQTLSWSHFQELPVDNPLARDFYAEMCRIERWGYAPYERRSAGCCLNERPSPKSRAGRLSK